MRILGSILFWVFKVSRFLGVVVYFCKVKLFREDWHAIIVECVEGYVFIRCTFLFFTRWVIIYGSTPSHFYFDQSHVCYSIVPLQKFNSVCAFKFLVFRTQHCNTSLYLLLWRACVTRHMDVVHNRKYNDKDLVFLTIQLAYILLLQFLSLV